MNKIYSLFVIMVFIACSSPKQQLEPEMKEESTTEDSIVTYPVTAEVQAEIQRLKQSNPENSQPGEDTLYDGEPIVGDYYLYMEAYDMMDFSYQIRRKKAGKITKVSQLERSGCSFDRVRVLDMNFDGVLDLDVVTLACNNGESNPFHDVYLAKGDTFIKARLSGYSFPTPQVAEKKVYSVFRAPAGHIFEGSVGIWEEDSLVAIKEIHVYRSREPQKNTYTEYDRVNGVLKITKEYETDGSEELPWLMKKIKDW